MKSCVYDRQKLYIMENGFGLYKIGVSVNPEKRRGEVQASSGVPTKLLKTFKVLRIEKYQNTCFHLEQALHKKLHDFRKSGEWFSIDLKDLLSCVEGAVSNPRAFIHMMKEGTAKKGRSRFLDKDIGDLETKFPRAIVIYNKMIELSKGVMPQIDSEAFPRLIVDSIIETGNTHVCASLAAFYIRLMEEERLKGVLKKEQNRLKTLVSRKMDMKKKCPEASDIFMRMLDKAKGDMPNIGSEEFLDLLMSVSSSAEFCHSSDREVGFYVSGLEELRLLQTKL